MIPTLFAACATWSFLRICISCRVHVGGDRGLGQRTCGIERAGSTVSGRLVDVDLEARASKRLPHADHQSRHSWTLESSRKWDRLSGGVIFTERRNGYAMKRKQGNLEVIALSMAETAGESCGPAKKRNGARRCLGSSGQSSATSVIGSAVDRSARADCGERIE
jgi:hypothetical protein